MVKLDISLTYLLMLTNCDYYFFFFLHFLPSASALQETSQSQSSQTIHCVCQVFGLAFPPEALCRQIVSLCSWELTLASS